MRPTMVDGSYPGLCSLFLIGLVKRHTKIAVELDSYVGATAFSVPPSRQFIARLY